MSRCKWCDCVITSEDVEEWVYSQLESNTHLLHGVIHSNGFGHLLSLNGREGGSAVLSGRDIMNFWDGLCTTLSVRFVSSHPQEIGALAISCVYRIIDFFNSLLSLGGTIFISSTR